MKKLLTLFVIIWALGLLPCCKTSNPAILNKREKEINIIASEKLGGNTKCVMTDDNKYALCSLNEKQPNPTTVTFMILNNQNGEVILDVKSINGKVSWYNNTQLKIIEYQDFRTNDQQPEGDTYLFDVLEKKRLKANI